MEIDYGTRGVIVLTGYWCGWWFAVGMAYAQTSSLLTAFFWAWLSWAYAGYALVTTLAAR